MMNDVVKFLQENPVQYLATVGRDGKAKCRPFMFSGRWMASYGFVPTTRRTSTRICRPTLTSRFLFPARLMRGFV